MAGTASVALRARPGRPARTARVRTRFCPVTLRRPVNLARQEGLAGGTGRRARPEGLAETLDVSLVEVCEGDAPPGT